MIWALACAPEQVDAPAEDDAHSTPRAQIIEQFELLGIEPSNVDACGELGLLASIVDREGRYFMFCGEGAILQSTPVDTELLPMDEIEPLELYLRVSPETAPVPQALVTEDQIELVVSRELVPGPAIISDPNIGELDRPFFPQANTSTCPSITSYCAIVKEWAEAFQGTLTANSHWCSGPVVSSQRTASSQIGSLGHNVAGRQYVRPCSGESVLFQGQHRNPCTGSWDSTFNWLATSGRVWHMKLSQRYHNLCNKWDTNLRYKTSGGRHRYTGAFGTYSIT